MKTPQKLLVVALPAEAKPANRHFGLVRDNQADAFPLYRNQEMLLVISGVGKEAAQAATHWLGSMTEAKRAIWINLGTAGHPLRAVGEGLLASEIVDDVSGRCWTPRIPNNPPCDCERLTTFATAVTDYGTSGLCDMEAAGFYPTACNLTSRERVHCLKIVSDNPLQPTSNISGRMVSLLIENRLDILDQLIRLLEKTA